MKLRSSLCALVLVGSLILVGTCGSLLLAQTQVTIGASKDNTLYQDTAGALSDGAGLHFFTGRTNGGFIRRGLIAFDVAGHIPPGATILTAELTLNMSQTSSLGQEIYVHRVLADWGEGTSVAAGNEGGGAPATTGDATWVHRFFNSQLWASVGGDFSPTVSDSLAVAPVGRYTWGSTPRMVSDVQGWLDTPSSNFGWILTGKEDALQTTKRFDSKQNTVDSLRPRLVITYQGVTGVQEPGTGVREYSLAQNYPNPFNPSTIISFTLPHRSHISLTVWNVLGVRVATLLEGDLEAGTHRAAFDGAVLSSGIYYYRLRAGDFTETKKLLLIR
jgi:hypothetical protein